VPYSGAAFSRLTRGARLAACRRIGDARIELEKEGVGMDWYLGVLKKYAEFNGRARRKEYWMFVLFNIIISVVLSIIDRVIGNPEMGLGILGTLYALAVLLPSLAVGARRLHDTGRSGWWLLIGLIPCIGFIVLIIFTVEDSQAGDNQYGPNPKATPA
jgi:uncharacterized membrane protein YhaH (DUF805 family)